MTHNRQKSIDDRKLKEQKMREKYLLRQVPVNRGPRDVSHGKERLGIEDGHNYIPDEPIMKPNQQTLYLQASKGKTKSR